MQARKYSGLDFRLIELIYFINEAEKGKYLDEVNLFLSRLLIKVGDPRVVVLDRIANEDIDLAMLPDILCFTGDFPILERTERNKYYTIVKLCEFNIEQKRAAGISNYDFEEQLFQEVKSVDLAGYARLSLTYQLGELFAQIGLSEKRDYYFGQLRTTEFDISPNTVSEYYREVAEIYLETEENESALNWLKAGIALNPKLSVKKLIKELESK